MRLLPAVGEGVPLLVVGEAGEFTERWRSSLVAVAPEFEEEDWDSEKEPVLRKSAGDPELPELPVPCEVLVLPLAVEACGETGEAVSDSCAAIFRD